MKAMLSTRVLGKIVDKVENVYSVRTALFSTESMRTALRDSTCRSIYLTILSLFASSCSILWVLANSGVSRIRTL